MNQLSQLAQSAFTIDLAAVQAGENPHNSTVLKEGADLFLKHGCLLMKNAFDPGYIADLHREFVGKYDRYFQDIQFADALRVGDKRTMITLHVAGGFNAPGFYAPPRYFGLLKYLLSDAVILGSMGAVCALPGAQWQHQHRDHANIFDSTLVYPGGDRCYPLLPPYAITVVIPLVPLNQSTGSTRLWPGSHLVLDPHAMEGTALDPMVPLGDCYLMDYRIMHGGMPNNSNIVRPIIYNVYYRPWFRDAQNYPLQAPLSMTDEERRRVPPAYKGLFDWSFAKSNANVQRTDTTLANQRFYPDITWRAG